MATLLTDSNLYIFSGTMYHHFNLRSGHKEGTLKGIANDWPGVFQTIDACVNWGNGLVYFFQGPLFMGYDVTMKKVLQEPLQIASNWPGVWAYGIQAVLKVDNNTCYFFKKTQFVKYNILKKSTEEYPGSIKEKWNIPWSGITGALNLGNNKVLLFKEVEVIQYDLKKNCVDKGFPVSVDQYVRDYFSPR